MAPPARATQRGAAAPQTFAAQPVAAKVMLGGLIVAALSAIYYFALHSPLADSIQAAETRHRTLQNDMTQAEERQREYLRLREELATREPLDRANLRVLPEQAEMASFLQELNRLAETSGLAMRLVEPRPEEPSEHYVKLPVALRVTGRYHQLARFFNNVSRLERAISMEDIELANPHRSGDDVVLDVDVLATTYRRPSADEAATPRPAGG